MTTADLAAIHAASFTTPRPWSATELTEVLASPGAYLCRSPDGFAIGRVIAGEAELLTIAVLPAAQGQGQGRGLMDKIIAGAAARQADTLFLEVASDNAPAISLYRAAGFVESGRRRAYYRPPVGQPIDAIVMTRPVKAPE